MYFPRQSWNKEPFSLVKRIFYIANLNKKKRIRHLCSRWGPDNTEGMHIKSSASKHNWQCPHYITRLSAAFAKKKRRKKNPVFKGGKRRGNAIQETILIDLTARMMQKTEHLACLLRKMDRRRKARLGEAPPARPPERGEAPPACLPARGEAPATAVGRPREARSPHAASRPRGAVPRRSLYKNDSNGIAARGGN